MKNMYKINGNPEEFADLGVFHKLSQQFLPFAQKRMQFDKPVSINLISDPQNAKNPLGKTAYYNPGTMEVTVFVDNRHVKDILRSMAHELVHHTQNCRGEFEGGVHTGPGYAQEDGHMRKMEEEAYLEGQMTLRDFEDNLKENKTMSKKRLKEAVNTLDPDYKGPAFDFDALVRSAKEDFNKRLRVVMKKDGFSEDEIASITGQMASPGLGTTTDPPSAAQQAVADMFSGSEKEYAAAMGEPSRAMAGGRGLPGALEEAGKYDDGDGEDEKCDHVPCKENANESLEEGDGTICEECGGNGLHESNCSSHDRKNESLEEGWSNKKDQLLFERLVDKWIK